MAILPTRFKPLTRKFGALEFIAALALTASSVTAQAADFTVQIGAFGIAPQPTFTKDAADHGEVMVVKGGDGVTRVSIGRYSTKSDARNALARLQLAGYTDAYITNVTTGMSAAVSGRTDTQPAQANRQPSAPLPRSAPRDTASTAQRPARTITKPTSTSASSQRLPSGRQIVQPKNPAAGAGDDSAQAGRFRLRTHDTQSGKTKDVELVPAAAVAGKGVNEIPAHLRNKLVYLDGVPHIKEGDKFIPLNDAVDGKP